MKRGPYTPLSPRDFEARRLHNLLLLFEHAHTRREETAAAKSVCRATRRYVAEFYGLRGRE